MDGAGNHHHCECVRNMDKASENQDLENLQNNMQTPIQVQQQPQFPTINSVFGNLWGLAFP